MKQAMKHIPFVEQSFFIHVKKRNAMNFAAPVPRQRPKSPERDASFFNAELTLVHAHVLAAQEMHQTRISLGPSAFRSLPKAYQESRAHDKCSPQREPVFFRELVPILEKLNYKVTVETFDNAHPMEDLGPEWVTVMNISWDHVGTE